MGPFLGRSIEHCTGCVMVQWHQVVVTYFYPQVASIDSVSGISQDSSGSLEEALINPIILTRQRGYNHFIYDQYLPDLIG